MLVWRDSGVIVPAGGVLVWKTASLKSPGELFNLFGFGHSHHTQMLDMYDKFFMSFHKHNSFLRTRNAKIFFTSGQQIMFQNTLMETLAASLGDSIPMDALTLQFHVCPQGGGQIRLAPCQGPSTGRRQS